MTLRAILGVVLGLVARAWLATLRVRVEATPALGSMSSGSARRVLAFFHGTQFPILALRRRRTTSVMVSHSADGAMQARALGMLGLDVVRGSSSRGGARGLAALVRRCRGKGRAEGCDVAFAVDGPRGPYGVVKPGAAFVAARAGALLVPVGSAAASALVLRRAWDRFVLPWPFSRVAVVLGEPISPGVVGGPDCTEVGLRLAEAIQRANDRAAALLAAAPVHMVPSKEI